MRTATNLLFSAGLTLVVVGACSGDDTTEEKKGGGGGTSEHGGTKSGGASGAVATSGTAGVGARGGAAGESGDGGGGGRTGDGAGGSGAESGAGNSGDGGMGGSPPEACSTNSDCIEQGFDWPPICRRGRCIDITSDDCSIVMGTDHLQDSEPLIFGALVTNLNPANVERFRLYWSFKLAMDEFAEFAPGGGIPIRGEVRRPLLILCHGDESNTWLERSLDHLIETVGVPGVIAYTSPAGLFGAATRTLVQRRRDVFFVHHSGPDADLANMEDGGRVWHMLGGELDLAETYVPLVERVEEHVNPALSRTRPTRLVLVNPAAETFFGSTLPPRLNQILRINGTIAGDQRDVNYFIVEVAGFSLLEVAEHVAELEPDIVVDVSGFDETPGFIDAAARERGSLPPFYVLLASIASTPDLLYQTYLDPSLRTRVVGVNVAAAEDASMYNAYLNRVRFIAPSVLNMEGTENFYDPIYYLFYAAAAAGVSGEPNGSELGRAMERLISGERYDIGPDGIAPILARLTSDPRSTIGFHATMGAPLFDAVTGARITRGSVYCIGDDFTYAWDVLRYDEQTRELYGTFPCYDF